MIKPKLDDPELENLLNEVVEILITPESDDGYECDENQAINATETLLNAFSGFKAGDMGPDEIAEFIYTYFRLI